MASAQGLKGVVIQAAVDWDFLKQRPHHVADELAKSGLPVLFIENTGTRVPGLKDAGRLWSRLQHLLSPIRAGARAYYGETLVEVLSPSVLPLPFNRVALAFNKRILRRRVQGFLSHHGLMPEEVAMITNMATPAAAALTLDVPWFRAVYDVVSDPKLVEPRVATSEQRLLREADFVLFASETLRQAYADRGDAGHFRTFRDGFSTGFGEGRSEVSARVAGLPSPRFLYLGGLNRKVWVEALDELSQAFPNASLLLVGPVAHGEFRPPRRANVHLFPPVANYDDLAEFLGAANVALIPYVPDRYVAPMYPAKVNEYLVFGLPIVATATEELALLGKRVGPNTVYLAESPKGFPAMAARALQEDTPVDRERRMAFTRGRTWARRAEALRQLLVNGTGCNLDKQGRSAP